MGSQALWFYPFFFLSFLPFILHDYFEFPHWSCHFTASKLLLLSTSFFRWFGFVRCICHIILNAIPSALKAEFVIFSYGCGSFLATLLSNWFYLAYIHASYVSALPNTHKRNNKQHKSAAAHFISCPLLWVELFQVESESSDLEVGCSFAGVHSCWQHSWIFNSYEEVIQCMVWHTPKHTQPNQYPIRLLAH